MQQRSFLTILDSSRPLVKTFSYSQRYEHEHERYEHGIPNTDTGMSRSTGTQRGKATAPKTTSAYNNTYNKGKSKQSFKSAVVGMLCLL